MKIRIAIADDHAIVRDGIRAMCLAVADFECVFEASSAEEFLKLLPKNPVDIAVIDVQMPGLSGIELAESIREQRAEVSVLIFSGYMDEKTVLDAIAKGVMGYVSKDATLHELKQALLSVAAGEQFYSLSVGEILYKSYIRKQLKGEENEKTNNLLSDREEEVLKGFAEGMSYKEIAEKLFISPRTVETHKENIMKKLGLNSLADIIKYAIREGIIEL